MTKARDRRKTHERWAKRSTEAVHKDGNLAEDCANGEAHLTDGTLLGMNWYIEGIDGTIPQ